MIDSACEVNNLSKPLTVGKLVTILRQVAPNELAEDWDSNTLICGDPGQSVRTVLLAVDPLPTVIDEAIETGVDMIVTHHPLFLRGTDNVAATTSKGRSVHRLIRAGIALANAHTSWDSAAGGMADALATALQLVDVSALAPRGESATVGIGRIGSLLSPCSLRAFAQHVCEVLPTCAFGLLVGGELDAEVCRVAVCPGAGDSLLDTARKAGADVFLTADLRHHPATEHLSEGRPYLLCASHWASEWVGLPALATKLEQGAQQIGSRLTTRVSTRVSDAWNLRLS